MYSIRFLKRICLTLLLFVIFIYQPAKSSVSLQEVKEFTLSKQEIQQEQEIKGGDSHKYKLQLTAGEFLFLTAEQKGIDIIVHLLGPDNLDLLEVNYQSSTQGKEELYRQRRMRLQAAIK
jgi:hypothetical protein